MNFTVDCAAFNKALALVKMVAQKNSSMPILASVRIVATHGTLTLTATDLMIFVSVNVEANVRAVGECAIDAATLAGIFKAQKGRARVTMGDGMGVKFEIGAATRKVKSQDYAKMPDFPKGDAVTPFERYHTTVLGSAIKTTAHAISKDETRPHLNGLQFEKTNGHLRAMSTDGHRLSISYIGDVDAKSHGFLLPRDAVMALSKMLAPFDGVVAISTMPAGGGSKWARFEFEGGHALIAKSPDTQFPPYRQVILKSFHHRALLPRTVFLAAAQAAMGSASKKTFTFKMNWSDALTISTEYVEAGVAEYVVPAEDVQLGAPTKEIPSPLFGVNGQYIVDALKAIEEEFVVVGWNGNTDPIAMYGMDDDGGTSNDGHVIMPIRI